MINLIMEKQVKVNNTGIESAGLTDDYMEAIAEFVWNGYDAHASTVNIEFDSNELDHITTVKVIDNGDGVNLTTIEDTFGNFMDSVKKNSYKKSSSQIKGNKGKGRFSFAAFCNTATWNTSFKDESTNKYLKYDIVIRAHKKDKYIFDNKKVSPDTKSGTTVIFSELLGVTAYSFSSDAFQNYLRREFGWFLLLNKERNHSLQINSVDIKYEPLIAEDEVRILPIKSNNKEIKFKITYVRWKEKIGDKFYFYFLNSTQKEIGKKLTSFNNNAIEFYHSIYIESDFFDTFSSKDDEDNPTLFSNVESSSVYKVLLSSLQQFVKEKQKDYVNEVAAKKLIDIYERNGAIPKFRNNKYEQAKKKDLISVVKGLYCIEPKLFKGLNKEQQKISIGLINILLDTDERTTIIDLIGQIISVSSQERETLLGILKKTTIAKVAKTVNMIEARFKVIELIKTLTYDLKKFTTEIGHLQKAIEESYWIFGEQYHLVSANESFSVLYQMYLDVVSQLESEDEQKRKKVKRKDQEEQLSNRRPDIFLCRKHSIPDATDNQFLMEENLMVELKRPTVIIGKEQLRQIEDYLEIVRTDDRFNSQKRFWKFFIVGNRVDDFVRGQYESQKEKGKKFLVKGVNNYEIYAYTWDDIFMMFELRHKFLVDHLDFDKEAIKRDLIEKGINIFDEPDPGVITMKVHEIHNSK